VGEEKQSNDPRQQVRKLFVEGMALVTQSGDTMSCYHGLGLYVLQRL